MQTFKSKLERFDSKLWGHHFKVEAEIGDLFVEGKDRRVICIINKKVKIPCALMPYGRGGYFINLNQEVRKSLKLKIGDEIEYTLEKDKSKYGMPMPEEMEELLKIDPEADDYFHALTPGKQRNLIYIVAKPKSSALRLHKALGITEFLKLNKGVLEFKEMYEFLKNFNKI